MPQWMHNRAEHILAKNPSMPKSEAFAIATQQSHALGKSPKGYGTAEGKREARARYDTPKDDRKTDNPGYLESPKMASGFTIEYGNEGERMGFSTREEELHRILGRDGSFGFDGSKETLGPVKMAAMRMELEKISFGPKLVGMLEGAAKARGVTVPALQQAKNPVIDLARRKEITKNIAGTLRGIKPQGAL